jgi:hypothetical protein
VLWIFLNTEKSNGGRLVVTFLKFGCSCFKVKDWAIKSTYSETQCNMRSAKLEVLTALLMKVKDKVTPLQARCGPEGGQRYSSTLP